MSVDAVEFTRRFLLHVLPAGFVKIRHFGFLANANRRASLNLCRSLLAQAGRSFRSCSLSLRLRPSSASARCAA